MTEQYKQDSAETNRRARKSAAMIGLAISMGATSLMMPRQGDEAMATESPSAANNVRPSLTDGALTHVVQPRQTLSQIAQMHNVAMNELASENRISVNSVLQVGRVLKVPASSAPGTAALLRQDIAADRSVTTDSMVVGDVQKDNPVSLDIGKVAAPVPTLPAPTVAARPQSIPAPTASTDTPRPVVEPAATRLDGELGQLAAAPQNSEAATHPSTAVLPEISGSLESIAEEVVVAAVAPSLSNRSAMVGWAEIDEVSAPDAPKLSTSIPAIAAESPVEWDEQSILARAESRQDETNVASATAIPETVAVELPALSPEVAIAPRETASAPEAMSLAQLEESLARRPALPASPDLIATAPESSAASAFVDPSVTASTSTPSVPSSLETVMPESARVYRVQPGDTLAAIAAETGLGIGDLASVNGLNDPNRLQVDQVLQVPNPEASVTHVIAANEIAANDANEIEPTEETQSEPVTALADDRRIALNRTSAPQYSPYIEGLKAEIQAMRDRYQSVSTVITGAAATNHEQDAAPSETADPVGTAKAAIASTPQSRPSTEEAAQPENPQFAPQRFASTLQAELQGLQDTYRGASTLPLAALPTVPEAATTSAVAVPDPVTDALPQARPQGQPVATAPTELSANRDRIDELIGSTVSPELPPLAAANEYLPGSNSFDGYIWPTRGILTSGYGWRWGRMHRGLDVAAPTGTPIVAAAAGVVVTAGWNSGGYGNLVDIRHPDGSLTRYAHNSRLLVRSGQQVRQGQLISEMGSTGFSTGPHLHFEIHPSGRSAINPISFLPRGGLQAAR